MITVFLIAKSNMKPSEIIEKLAIENSNIAGNPNTWGNPGDHEYMCAIVQYLDTQHDKNN